MRNFPDKEAVAGVQESASASPSLARSSARLLAEVGCLGVVGAEHPAAPSEGGCLHPDRGRLHSGLVDAALHRRWSRRAASPDRRHQAGCATAGTAGRRGHGRGGCRPASAGTRPRHSPARGSCRRWWRPGRRPAGAAALGPTAASRRDLSTSSPQNIAGSFVYKATNCCLLGNLALR